MKGISRDRKEKALTRTAFAFTRANACARAMRLINLLSDRSRAAGIVCSEARRCADTGVIDARGAGGAEGVGGVGCEGCLQG